MINFNRRIINYFTWNIYISYIFISLWIEKSLWTYIYISAANSFNKNFFVYSKDEHVRIVSGQSKNWRWIISKMQLRCCYINNRGWHVFRTHHNVTQAFITLTWPLDMQILSPSLPFSTTCHTVQVQVNE